MGNSARGDCCQLRLAALPTSDGGQLSNTGFAPARLWTAYCAMRWAMELGLEQRLPEEIAETELQRFSQVLASLLISDMLPTLQPLYCKDAQGERNRWSAHSWQADGTYVALEIDPAHQLVRIYLNTRGPERPQQDPAAWVGRVLWAIMMFGLAFGFWRQNWWIGLSVPGLALATWIGFDVSRQIAKERSRSIDRGYWEQQFARALKDALAETVAARAS